MSIHGFDELKARMEVFQGKLHDYINEQRSTLLQLLDSYKEDVENYRIKKDSINSQLNQLVEEERELTQEIRSIQEQTQQTNSKMEAYEIKKQQLTEERGILERDRWELKELLAKKQKEIQRHKESIKKQHLRDNPEVKVYEQLLGLKITTPKPDTLCFNFINVSENSSNAQCNFTLDLSSNGYKILDSSPKLSQAQSTELEQNLAITGDLPTFLKQVRSLLLDRMST
ncbi:kinetochore-associated Ndc80 complex subunit SPC25 Ecym_1076 [Eremothecium cymbalariae DBVPG|uniref:Kinetochore protein SPC25 n=1 Tax=Eremothecium cymbalariae (strain CBS 270.75 / DBVPG 7215 / KCTC 17166 / NRRL Y-17582) TaxID=931890 RepID=G8JMC5_ERECY|nr:hypothetical protein Ecym_1076 [Eremothecium cymbalariae DBVPG\